MTQIHNLVEVIKVSIPAIAIVGAIFLGVRDPQHYGIAAIGVLSGAVSGFYGAQVPTSTPARQSEASIDDVK